MTKAGFTLVEVIITIAISVLGASLCFFFIQSVRSHKSNIDRSLAVKEVLADNVIEAKGLRSEDLPPLGSCLIRTYTQKKVFLSESLITGACPEPNMATTEMQIMWELASPGSVTVNFSSPSLKLPSFNPVIKQITIHSWNYPDPSSVRISHSQTVVFRR